MRRRDLIAMLGGAMAAWPRSVWAQQPAMPEVGVLTARSPADMTDLTAALRKGLRESGYVEGQNLALAYRYAEGHYEKLTALATELVDIHVAVIITTGGSPVARAAMAATTTIPIVFTTGSDPVSQGLVASLNRPGGNLTGVAFLTGALEAKRFEILHDLIPSASVGAYLFDLDTPSGFDVASEHARRFGLQLFAVPTSANGDLDAAFAAIVQQRADVLFVAADPFLNSEHQRIAALANRFRLPSVYDIRDFVVSGGLASYGPSFADGYRQAGIYAGRILKGDKSTDLPVVQSSKFELVINLKTAQALGLTISREMLLRADEVIE